MARERSEPEVTGGCLCGAVRYSVHGPLRGVVACHCRFCRRTTSHFAAYSACATADLEITGERKLRWYRSSPIARRGFCTRCGSPLFWERNGADATSIAAGTLNEPTGLTMAKHICVNQKGDYYEIADGVPQEGGHTPTLPVPS